jgi:hypothetical protein
MNSEFDPKKPYRQRNGQPAEILCDDLDGDFPFSAKITVDGRKTTARLMRDGRYYKGQDTPHDLVNLRVKKTGWLNIYPAKTAVHLATAGYSVYQTREDANTYTHDDRIACVQITWEE